jgi:hypothetical protein
VPRGDDGGGQWTDGGGSGAGFAISRDESSTPTPTIRLAGGFEPEHLGMTVEEFSAALCRGSINRKLPGQFLGMTIADVLAAKRAGNQAARMCIKLPNEDRFRK